MILPVLSCWGGYATITVTQIWTQHLYIYGTRALKLSQRQAQGDYEPTVSVSTKKVDGKVEIRVGDSGNGIPQKVRLLLRCRWHIIWTVPTALAETVALLTPD